jgi:hypothetical protein
MSAISTQGSLLGILDAEMETRFGYDLWVEKLLHGILFEPVLKAPDIFFFISKHLENHLLKDSPGTSLFTAALQKHVIVPAFRTDDRSKWGFRTAVRDFRSRNRTSLRSTAETIADLLDNQWEYKKENDAVFFSRCAAREMYHLSRELVGIECPPSIRHNTTLAELWGTSKDLRSRTFDEACAVSERSGRHGEVTRTDWMQAIAKEFGVINPEQYEHSATLVQSIPEKYRDGVALTLDAMHGCYAVSVSHDLVTTSAVPSWREADGIVADALVSRGKTTANQTLHYRRDALGVSLEIPPLHALRQVPPDELVAVCVTVGRTYKTLVTQWQQGDPDVSAAKIQVAADEYAKHLRKKFPSLRKMSRVELIIDSLGDGVLPLFYTAVVATSAAILPGAPEYRPLIVGHACLWAIYRYLDNAPVYTQYEVSRRVDIGLPTRAISDDGLDVALL